MSWSFNAEGSPKHVREQVAKQTEPRQQEPGIRGCIEAAEAACVAAESVYEGKATVAVEASGHLAPGQPYGNVDLRIRIHATI